MGFAETMATLFWQQINWLPCAFQTIHRFNPHISNEQIGFSMDVFQIKIFVWKTMNRICKKKIRLNFRRGFGISPFVGWPILNFTANGKLKWNSCGYKHSFSNRCVVLMIFRTIWNNFYFLFKMLLRLKLLSRTIQPQPPEARID